MTRDMITTDNSPRSPITVALLGNSGVGKTSLAHRLTWDTFKAFAATPSLNSFKIRLNLPVGEPSTVDLVDFGGGRHHDVVREILRAKPAIAVVVVDGICGSSAEDMAYWNNLLAEQISRDFLQSKVLVFARMDAGGISVANIERLVVYARELGFSDVIQTSAKTGDGIQTLRAAVDTEARALAPEGELDKTAAGLVVRALADRFCRLIADRPGFLRHVEWRDLERVIASAIEEMGFEVALTPTAKDGGKDVVARCCIRNRSHTFYVEIKHWRKTRPGMLEIHDFIQVNAQDRSDGGLFLSSSGFTNEVYARIGDVSRQRVRLGEEEKIVSLCKMYVKSKEGVWRPEAPLPEILFADALGEAAPTRSI
jgi:GTPase SAR1 family protein